MGQPDTSVRPLPYPAAVARLLDEFGWNSWFTGSYWPENEPRVRLVADLLRGRVPAGGRVLEVGCANGFVALLARHLGYEVAACDAWEPPERPAMFARAGIDYSPCNLNDPDPLPGLPPAAFDAVLLGEVFEHLLNHPAGVLAACRRLLKPGGLFVLTTPNPSTLAAAWRVLRDRNQNWGTDVFLREPKFDGGRVIDRGEVHYQEYPAGLVAGLMTEVGFRVDAVRYVRTGSSAAQSRPKRLAKFLLRAAGLADRRLFAPGYVIAATA